MKPIYKFVLDEETGKITVQEITDYNKVNEKWLTKSYYRYTRNNLRYYIYDADLDKFKHGHVYSFDPDILHAKSIIMNTVKIRRVKAKREYERWNDVFEKLRRD